MRVPGGGRQRWILLMAVQLARPNSSFLVMAVQLARPNSSFLVMAVQLARPNSSFLVVALRTPPKRGKDDGEMSGEGERNVPETKGSIARTGATGGAMDAGILAWSSSLSD